jgi:signal transduction histidine kinase
MSETTRLRLSSGASIAARLWLAFAALAALFVAVGALGFWGARETAREIERVERSLNQLELARAVEAAFNRYLLTEIGRRLTGDVGPEESREAALLRGVLLNYRRAIDASLAGADRVSLEASRQRLLRARTLVSLFDAIETESMLDRRLRATGEGEQAAVDFLTRIAGERDGAFREILSESLEEERARAEAAYARLDALREGLAVRGAALALVFLAAAAAAGIVFHRSLTRPIGALETMAEAFGGGAREARAPAELPGEFATLASAFNAMADRIAGEQSRLEAEVGARTEALRRVDQTRRRFFANVSHELRTPVTVLLGEAQVAMRARDDVAALRGALERIAGSGGYLRRRLDDLMALARSEDGALSLAIGRAELNAVAAGAVETAAAYAAAHEIALTLRPETTDVCVAGDAEALRQAALALIDNAVKFSPPGGEVAVIVSQSVDGAALTVTDRGPGFGALDPETLFDRYAQAQDGRRAGGAGLGLAIVKWIADQHGATVRAANRDGGGAEIVLALKRTA